MNVSILFLNELKFRKMNHYLFIVFYLCVYAASGRAQTVDDCELVHLVDDDDQTFESASPYDKNLCRKITTAPGHKIEITVNSVDIDGTAPVYDYLLIKPGLLLEDPGSGKVFTHILNRERSYILFSNNVFIQFNAHLDNDGNINPNLKKGFKMTYRRIGEEIIITTTEAPDPNPLPTPGGGDTIYLIVYLRGKRLFEYTQDFVEQLRTVIMEMAKAYCIFADVPINENATLNTHENVLIHSLMDCPWNWPDRDHCVSMQFSLPLHMQPNYEGYQLNQTNMRNMWYHFNMEYLSTLDLHDYEAPDAQASINIWIILIVCITVAFVIFLGVFKCLLDNVMKPKGASMLKLEEDENNSNGNNRLSHRLSGAGWTYDDDLDDMQPDPYQTFPQAPSYDDDDNTMYRIYDDHSNPKPDNKLVVLMDPGEYGEAYS